jgi:hypothetical protein
MPPSVDAERRPAASPEAGLPRRRRLLAHTLQWPLTAAHGAEPLSPASGGVLGGVGVVAEVGAQCGEGGGQDA